MIVSWDNYHLIDGRDFEDMKKRANKRFSGKDIRIVHWGFKPLGTPFAIVEAVMPKERKSVTPAPEPMRKAVGEGLLES